MKTLRGRLLGTLAAVLLLLFAAEWVLFGIAMRRIHEEGVLAHLGHDGEAILLAIEWKASGPAIDPRRVETGYLQPASGSYFVVRVDRAQTLASASLQGFEPRLRPVHAGEVIRYDTDGPLGQSLIVRASRHRLEGRELELHVAEDQGGIEKEIRRLGLASLAVFLPLLVAALMLQAFAVRRALRPLMAIGDELRSVGAGRNARIEGPAPLEIKPLVDELNRLLALLQRRLKQSRGALGDLAHALKTPLAILVRHAESQDLPPDRAAAIRQQARAIADRLERELRRARLSGPAAPGEGARFNPHAELPELVKVLQAVHHGKDLAFEVEAPDASLPFDREDVLELAGNLADNACKWARSRVAIAARAGADGALQIEVGDDGPGASPEQIARMTGRGVKLDERWAGHGLGLAIVSDIADMYDGSVDFGRDPRLGGLLVRVTLPAPPSSITVGPCPSVPASKSPS